MKHAVHVFDCYLIKIQLNGFFYWLLQMPSKVRLKVCSCSFICSLYRSAYILLTLSVFLNFIIIYYSIFSISAIMKHTYLNHRLMFT